MSHPGLLRRLVVALIVLVTVSAFVQQRETAKDRGGASVRRFTADVALNSIIALQQGPARPAGLEGMVEQAVDSMVGTAAEGYEALKQAPKPGEAVDAEEIEKPYLRLAALYLTVGEGDRAVTVLEEAERRVARRSAWKISPVLARVLRTGDKEAEAEFLAWQRAHMDNLAGLVLGLAAAEQVEDAANASQYATLLRERSTQMQELLALWALCWVVVVGGGLVALLWIAGWWRGRGMRGLGRAGALEGGMFQGFEIVAVLAFSQVLVSWAAVRVLRAWVTGPEGIGAEDFVVLLAASYVGMALLTAVYVLNVMYPWQRLRGGDVGLARSSVGRTVLWGLGWALASALVVLVVGAVWGQLVRGGPLWHPVMGALAERPPRWAVVWLLVLGVVVAPLVEEIVFRGYVYPRFKSRVRMGYAMLLTGAMFALVHGSAVAFLPIMVLGMGLCLLYERTGSVWPCVVCHGAFNGFQFVLLMTLLRVAWA